MKWFKHFTDATMDSKIKKLILRYGAEGYAIYFHCLELISGDITSDNITFELEHDAEIIADNLKIKPQNEISAIDKVNEIMLFIIDIGLFETSDNKIFCFKLAKILDNSTLKSPELQKVQKKLKSGTILENPGNSLPDKNRIDKIRIEENRTEEIRKEENPEEKTPEKNFPEDALLTTQYFYDQIQKHVKPPTYKNKPPNLNRWAEDIDKINRLDGIDWDTIIKVIDHTVKHKFWSMNVLSGEKLRKQFNVLYLDWQTNRKMTAEEIEEHTRKTRQEYEDIKARGGDIFDLID